MSLHPVSKLLAVLVLSMAASSCAQLDSRQTGSSIALSCPPGIAQAKCLAELEQTLANTAIAINRCGTSSCGPGPVVIGGRERQVLPPSDMQQVIGGIVRFAEGQGLSREALVRLIQQAKIQ